MRTIPDRRSFTKTAMLSILRHLIDSPSISNTTRFEIVKWAAMLSGLIKIEKGHVVSGKTGKRLNIPNPKYKLEKAITAEPPKTLGLGLELPREFRG